MSDEEQGQPPIRRVRARDRKRRITTTAAPPPPIEVEGPMAERFPPAADEIPRNLRRRRRAKDAPMAQRRPLKRQDLIAALFVLLTIGTIGLFAVIWQNPYSPLNPFAPPAPVIRVIVPPNATDFRFMPGQLYYQADREDCERFTIAGSVRGASGQYAIRVTTEAGFDQGYLTGAAPNYGPNGFSISFTPTEREYTLQLYDTNGLEIAPPLVIEVRPVCDLNQAVIHFEPQGQTPP
ncbi:MAG: hypothetical protein MUF87_18195 [Anaerolineae bacterium]|jgi:hypothetical protein|nr:hypothetical protein [Anaerolineae bacterium]